METAGLKVLTERDISFDMDSGNETNFTADNEFLTLNVEQGQNIIRFELSGNIHMKIDQKAAAISMKLPRKESCTPSTDSRGTGQFKPYYADQRPTPDYSSEWFDKYLIQDMELPISEKMGQLLSESKLEDKENFLSTAQTPVSEMEGTSKHGHLINASMINIISLVYKHFRFLQQYGVDVSPFSVRRLTLHQEDMSKTTGDAFLSMKRNIRYLQKETNIKQRGIYGKEGVEYSIPDMQNHGQTLAKVNNVNELKTNNTQRLEKAEESVFCDVHDTIHLHNTDNRKKTNTEYENEIERIESSLDPADLVNMIPVLGNQVESEAEEKVSNQTLYDVHSHPELNQAVSTTQDCKQFVTDAKKLYNNLRFPFNQDEKHDGQSDTLSAVENTRNLMEPASDNQALSTSNQLMNVDCFQNHACPGADDTIAIGVGKEREQHSTNYLEEADESKFEVHERQVTEVAKPIEHFRCGKDEEETPKKSVATSSTKTKMRNGNLDEQKFPDVVLLSSEKLASNNQASVETLETCQNLPFFTNYVNNSTTILENKTKTEGTLNQQMLRDETDFNSQNESTIDKIDNVMKNHSLHGENLFELELGEQKAIHPEKETSREIGSKKLDSGCLIKDETLGLDVVTYTTSVSRRKKKSPSTLKRDKQRHEEWWRRRCQLRQSKQAKENTVSGFASQRQAMFDMIHMRQRICLSGKKSQTDYSKRRILLKANSANSAAMRSSRLRQRIWIYTQRPPRDPTHSSPRKAQSCCSGNLCRLTTKDLKQKEWRFPDISVKHRPCSTYSKSYHAVKRHSGSTVDELVNHPAEINLFHPLKSSSPARESHSTEAKQHPVVTANSRRHLPSTTNTDEENPRVSTVDTRAKLATDHTTSPVSTQNIGTGLETQEDPKMSTQTSNDTLAPGKVFSAINVNRVPGRPPVTTANNTRTCKSDPAVKFPTEKHLPENVDVGKKESDCSGSSNSGKQRGNVRSCRDCIGVLLDHTRNDPETILLKEHILDQMHPVNFPSRLPTAYGLARCCLPHKEQWQINQLMTSTCPPHETLVHNILRELKAEGLKLSHVVQFFTQESTKRLDITKLIAKIHPSCEFCSDHFTEM